MPASTVSHTSPAAPVTAPAPVKAAAIRQAMVLTAARWLPQRGMAAVNLVEVARAVGAPRGSIYHYFAGGRDQLLQEALALAGKSGLRLIDTARRHANTPEDLVRALFNTGQLQIQARSSSEAGFSGGCPVGAAVLSSETETPAFHAALQTIFEGWHTALADAFVAISTVTPLEAQRWARSSLVAYEGALVCAKASASPAAAAEVFSTAADMVTALIMLKSVEQRK